MDYLKRFKEFIELIHVTSKFSPVRPIPKTIKFSSNTVFPKSSRNFGLINSGNELIISSDFKQSKLLLDIILIREAIRLFMPSALDDIEEPMDIGLAAAYHLLKNQENEELLMKKWKESSERREFGRITYDPEYILTFYEHVEEDFFRFVFEMLFDLCRNREKINPHEFVFSLDKFMKNFSVPLDKFDIKIMNKILEAAII